MLTIRMKRMGRTHKPFYRINAIDSRNPRDGKVVEQLGTYDPVHKDEEKQITLKEDRIRYWLDKGATTSPTVASILKRKGITATS